MAEQTRASLDDVGNKGAKRREIKPSEVKFFHFTSINRSFEAAQEVRDNGKTSDSAYDCGGV